MSAPPNPIPTTYAALRRAVETVVLKGRQQIERAWVQTYHECGRMIHEHLLLKKEKAAYGAYLYRQLAADTGVDIRTLQQSVQFYRTFPIASARSQLGWAHYRTLLHVADPAKRQELKLAAEREHWTSRELEAHVRALNATLPNDTAPVQASSSAGPKLLTPKRGTPGISRVIARGETLAVDLGFKLYVELADDAGFRAGDFVRFDARGRVLAAEHATKADLFTYVATVRRVVDGDTLEIEVRLPRGFVHVMKLRLRGLDCPEMDTPEGKAAKRYVESRFIDSREVTLYTTKPDKYDRYVADVFVPNGSGESIFLNNELLKNGHAIPKYEYHPADWDS